MKYVFKFTEVATGKEIAFEGGRTSLWDAQDASVEWPKRPTNAARLDFAWGYCAAKRAGKLAELGVEGMGQDEAIEAIADSYDMSIDDNKGSAPLAARPE